MGWPLLQQMAAEAGATLVEIGRGIGGARTQAVLRLPPQHG